MIKTIPTEEKEKIAMGREVSFDYSKAAEFISAEELENIKGAVSVSYTHLDVYKRQPYGWPGS